MLKYNTLIILLCLLFPAQAQHPPVFEGIVSDTTRIAMNDLTVNLVRYTYRTPGIQFLAIHDDEDTGVKAAFEYIRFSGGTLIDCQYGGIRNFRLSNQGERFQTDPNSIYTKKGLPIGIEKYGLVDDDVVKHLERGAKTILQLYDPEKQGYIFTLHNNTDGDFGIASYLKGYELETSADSVYINFGMDPDDLVFVTDLKLFNGLKKENVNVVLQSANAPDDGSLSIYAMLNKIPYINVEVQHGHYDENLRLIEIAIKVLYQAYPQLKQKASKEGP
ncbi:hypothetical protein [Pedobacter africanus]|uniref:N-acetylmuramoyl-L-alanine amidase n=1 Tax=Pedobacter africanus TaxID=151894 RepID=A0A1W2BY35_9SPHI|nr:hypothetical protein [Pedobacter africanus]SMC77877.1 hypothetical protein SAMN04488524_2745 [Pedobacter africanus]